MAVLPSMDPPLVGLILNLLASGKFVLKTGLLGYEYPRANRTRSFFFIKK